MRTTGTVKWFDEQKGFGFIRRGTNEPEVFIHFSGIDNVGQGRARIAAGDRVEFDVVEDKRGPKASALRVLETAQ